MNSIRALIALALLCPAAAAAQAPSPTRDLRRDQQFAEAGFPPLVTVRDAPVDVRHMVLRDPYSALPIPGVSVERFADGRIELTLRYRTWSEPPIALDDAQWQRLVEAARLDRASEAEREAVAPQAARAASEAASQPSTDTGPRPFPPPPPICHAWSALLRDGERGHSSWSGCRNEPPPAALLAMLAIAMATRPDCEARDDDPYWSFQRCFRASSFDNAELGAALAALSEDQTARPVAPLLSEARWLLVNPALSIGSPEWIAVRDKIETLRILLADKRTELHRINRFERTAMTPSDRARSDAQIRNMRDFLDSQDRNLIGLMAQLVNVRG